MFDFSFMRVSLEMAELAAEKDSVPVGAVITLNGEIIAKAHNDMQSLHKSIPKAMLHAEMIVLIEASERLGVNRLDGCDIYVTLEPCQMCLGAVALMRVNRIIFGAYSYSVFRNLGPDLGGSLFENSGQNTGENIGPNIGE
ncbi:MAG: nucleoside deaminase, partial [Holosporales bacterium]|nr:nucleoside deaminase [Holosporales bacterium]